MNESTKMPKLVTSLALFGLIVINAQESQTYRELFNVNPEAEVILNTAHADIEFATWDKNEVLVEAVVTLEGATPEEAKTYFERPGVEILGNSSRVEVSTRPENNWGMGNGHFPDFEFEIPAIPEVGQILKKLRIPETHDFPELNNLSPVPPMPPMAIEEFDYKAFEQEGEAYFKRWKKQFDKKFKHEYQSRLEEWSRRTQERAETFKNRQREMEQPLLERTARREAYLEQAEKAQVEAQTRRREELDRLREDLVRSQEAFNMDRRMGTQAPKTFFFRGREGNRNFNIQKIIKITLPKEAKLQLNVRHGAVKLASSAHNLKANLSYASLLAAAIEGPQTQVAVKFAPVSVKRWNSGKLNTEFSEDVVLDQVRDLDLMANSSEVTIGNLLHSVSIENNLGQLRIKSVAPDFKRIQVQTRNGELDLKLPESPFNIQMQQENSTVHVPDNLIWSTKSNTAGFNSGYFRKNNPNSVISLEAQFSTLSLHQ